MRLLRTRNLELKEFYGSQVPPYAILSHTWGDDEITFQEFTREDDSQIYYRKGYQKITKACERARRKKIEWIWIDTICIDKTSSAELSEAINSMFAWYRDSTVCYAYLADVPSRRTGLISTVFGHSRWFTRGWTLQELLAPKELKFYTSDWVELRFADSRDKVLEISQETGIAEEYLNGRKPLADACIGEKMSWLSRRTTTRVEDIAYCALGIFDINMPLLYGEGKKAFVRLQEHIVQESNDHTIFCWSWGDEVPETWASMLAPHPSTFRHSYCGNLRRSLQRVPRPFSMTNVGLSLSAPVHHTVNGMIVRLDAYANDKPETRLCIPLKRMPFSNVFRRLPSVIAPFSYDVRSSAGVEFMFNLFPKDMQPFDFYVQHKPLKEEFDLRFGTRKDFDSGQVFVMLCLSSDKEGYRSHSDQSLDPSVVPRGPIDEVCFQGISEEDYFDGDGLLRLSYCKGLGGDLGTFAGALKISTDLCTHYVLLSIEVSGFVSDIEAFGFPILKDERCQLIEVTGPELYWFAEEYKTRFGHLVDQGEDVDILRVLLDDFQLRQSLAEVGSRQVIGLKHGCILGTMQEEQQLAIKTVCIDPGRPNCDCSRRVGDW